MNQSQSPKEALKALVRGLAPDALGARAIMMDECMAAIDQLGVPAEGWVSVEDLPIPEDVLIDLFVRGMRRAGCYFDRICDEWRQVERGILICFKRRDISHWMPLPAAPKEPT